MGMDMVKERQPKPPRGVASLRLDKDEWVVLMHGRRYIYGLLGLLALAAGVTLWVAIETYSIAADIRATQLHHRSEK